MEEWDQVFAVNVRATFLGIKYVVRGVLAQRHGVITNTASAVGLVGPVGLPGRAATGGLHLDEPGAAVVCAEQVGVLGIAELLIKINDCDAS